MHEFMSLDGVIDTPTGTLDYGPRLFPADAAPAKPALEAVRSYPSCVLLRWEPVPSLAASLLPHRFQVWRGLGTADAFLTRSRQSMR